MKEFLKAIACRAKSGLEVFKVRILGLKGSSTPGSDARRMTMRLCLYWSLGCFAWALATPMAIPSNYSISASVGAVAFIGASLLIFFQIVLLMPFRDNNEDFQLDAWRLVFDTMVSAVFMILVFSVLYWNVGLLWVRLPADAANRYPHQFSGGQRQRICIARALALQPDLIIADESVSALDVSVQAQVLDLLQELKQDLGLAYLFISHDMAVVENVADRVGVMYLGQIVEMGSCRQVFGNPQHPYTKRLIEAVPVPDPTHIRASNVRLTGEVPSPVYKADHKPDPWHLTDIGNGHYVAER
ncbi:MULTISPECIES: oligopeptide/dipeptide ABC transporter ATP-binding protein [Phaeobacter]|uniref:oligopeptide/dipeptide ABC transporter ATP-binding protein n=1 Tax=Phaeobacter TaxID=302485 RepID=UPI003A863198